MRSTFQTSVGILAGLIFAGGGGVTPSLQAQTFIVSNLLTDAEAMAQQSSISGQAVDFESWHANSFTTDSERYTLDSVTISHNFFNYAEPAFIAVYDNASTDLPGIEVGQFNDSNRMSNTNFFLNRHTFSGNIALEADTEYWLVFGTTTDPANVNGGFNYLGALSTDQSGDWEIGDTLYASANRGSSWTADTFSGPIMFGMQATIVPEPSEYALAAGLLLMGFIAFRRRRFICQDRIG